MQTGYQRDRGGLDIEWRFLVHSVVQGAKVASPGTSSSRRCGLESSRKESREAEGRGVASSRGIRGAMYRLPIRNRNINAPMASITAAAFKKLSAFDKRAKLIGADIRPIEAIGEGDNKELHVTAVHRASAETVNSVPVNEIVRHSLGLWWFLFFDASDAQRSLV